MDLSEFADKCLAAITAAVKPEPGQHVLVVAFDNDNALQMRIPGALDVTASVGALTWAALAIHAVRTLPFDEPPLTGFVEECLEAVTAELQLEPGQHLVLVAFDDSDSPVQLRMPGALQLQRAVGALTRAATAIHSLRSLQTFRDDVQP